MCHSDHVRQYSHREHWSVYSNTCAEHLPRKQQRQQWWPWIHHHTPGSDRRISIPQYFQPLQWEGEVVRLFPVKAGVEQTYDGRSDQVVWCLWLVCGSGTSHSDGKSGLSLSPPITVIVEKNSNTLSVWGSGKDGCDVRTHRHTCNITVYGADIHLSFRLLRYSNG